MLTSEHFVLSKVFKIYWIFHSMLYQKLFCYFKVNCVGISLNLFPVTFKKLKTNLPVPNPIQYKELDEAKQREFQITIDKKVERRKRQLALPALTWNL